LPNFEVQGASKTSDGIGEIRGMCGIAGYSVGPESQVPRTLAAQALLAGIAERGADAVGYAHRSGAARVVVHKQRTGASVLLDAIAVPGDAAQVLLHVRDYTKGHPSIEANNHPIRHGSVVGIHNGVIANDDELFERHGFERALPEMTVDSEAIFALMQAHDGRAKALEELSGAMATAWLDEREPTTLNLARGIARPLWIGRGRHEAFFASTRAALEVVEDTLRLGLLKREVAEGRVLRLVAGRVSAEERFRPDRSYREDSPLPAVRAPDEGASCLERLAAIAAVA
jgi:glucosamine 6-phosphate synthetase-like amidotransferase/phosphosugar isomerase protein